jgi:hypothetical protein
VSVWTCPKQLFNVVFIFIAIFDAIKYILILKIDFLINRRFL